MTKMATTFNYHLTANQDGKCDDGFPNMDYQDQENEESLQL